MKNQLTPDTPDPLVDELLVNNVSLLEGEYALVIGDQAAWCSERIGQLAGRTSCSTLSFEQAWQIFIEKPDNRLSDNNHWSVVVLLQMKCDRPQKKCIGALLSRLRDVHADRVFHIVFSEGKNSDTRADCGWSLTDSLRMGFSVVQKIHTKNNSVALYEYSVRDYKTSPDWLNSKHWAHPHLWKREQ